MPRMKEHLRFVVVRNAKRRSERAIRGMASRDMQVGNLLMKNRIERGTKYILIEFI